MLKSYILLNDRSLFKVVCTELLIISLYIIPKLAHSIEPIITILPLADESQSKIFEESLNSQLADYGAKASLIEMPTDMTLENVSPTLAGKLLTDLDSIALVWVRQNEFYIYYIDGEQSNLFSRPVPGSDDSFALKCDAMAMAIRSMMVSILENSVDEEETPVKKDETPVLKPETPPLEVIDTETPFKEKKDNTPASTFRFGLGVEYAPTLMSRADGIVSGFAIRGKFNPKKPFSMDLSSGLKIKTSGNFSMIRVPFRIGAEGRIVRGNFSLSFETSFITEIVSLTNNGNLLSNASGAYIGIGECMTIAYLFRKKFELNLGVGADLFSSADKYLDANGNTIFEFKPLQGRLQLGALWWF